MRPLALSVFLPALVACTTPATAVEVGLGTDVPSDRAMTVAMRFVMNGHAVERTWTRGETDGGIDLPASFTLLPRSGAPENEVGELHIDASLGATPAGAPAVTISRVARFRFTRRVTQRLPIFLPYGCTVLVTGCAHHTAAECTVSALCDERGQTCGDDANCTAAEVTPVAVDRSPSPTWLADSFVSDATDASADASRCSVTDPFTTTSLGATWTGYDQAPGAAQFSWGQGTLTIAPHANASSYAYAGVLTRRTYDVRDGTASVEVAAVTSGTASETEFVLVDDAWEATFIAHGSSLSLRLWDVPRATTASIQRLAFDRTAHRFWRFRPEADGSLNWEVSPDRTTWQSLRRTATPIDLSDAYLGLSAGTWQADPNPGTAQFTNFALDAVCP